MVIAGKSDFKVSSRYLGLSFGMFLQDWVMQYGCNTQFMTICLLEGYILSIVNLFNIYIYRQYSFCFKKKNFLMYEVSLNFNIFRSLMIQMVFSKCNTT